MEITPSRCLVTISQLFNSKEISKKEKLTLKYLVFLEYTEVFQLFENAINDKITHKALVEELKKVAGYMTMDRIEVLKDKYHDEEALAGSPDIRKIKRKAQQKKKQNVEGNSPKDMMSPMSTTMIKIKRKNDKNSNKNSSNFSLRSGNFEHKRGTSYNADMNNGSVGSLGGLAPCNIGNSPEFTKSNLKEVIQKTRLNKGANTNS
ncbi:unnamed protein product [Moneuplotes crassus]|uniref:Uncharacterized protein n=1 Tax=Euplotes crassus TaxID=5936 RepID=A0AAD2D1R1_EUPCR|nr:unnamed protein product [Moneuplotes crassus]